MFRKSITIILALVFVLALATPALADWHNWDGQENIASNKVWTVKFNALPDPGTVNSQNIYVMDSADRTVPVEVKPVENEIVTVEPANNYAPGQYYLYISDRVTSDSGTKLKQPVKMPFTVESKDFEVLTYCMWTEYSYTHIAGEVVNNTGNAYSSTKVVVSLYDEFGNIVASDYTTISGVLNPNAHATFELMVPKNEMVNSVSFRVTPGYDEKPLNMDFEVMGSNFYKSSYDYGEAAVEYKKLSDAEYDSVIMFIGIYDSNNIILEANYRYLTEAEKMKKGEISSTNFSFRKGLPDNCSIKVFFTGRKWDF